VDLDIRASPGELRAGDRDAIKQIVDAKAQAYFERVNRTAEHWLPIVEDMRPGHRWQDVVPVLNAICGIR